MRCFGRFKIESLPQSLRASPGLRPGNFWYICDHVKPLSWADANLYSYSDDRDLSGSRETYRAFTGVLVALRLDGIGNTIRKMALNVFVESYALAGTETVSSLSVPVNVLKLLKVLYGALFPPGVKDE